MRAVIGLNLKDITTNQEIRRPCDKQELINLTKKEGYNGIVEDTIYRSLPRIVIYKKQQGRRNKGRL